LDLERRAKEINRHSVASRCAPRREGSSLDPRAALPIYARTGSSERTMPTAPVFDDAFRARLRALLTWRRDVRRFRRDPLPPGAVERLIELASLAPSVGLSQPWRFVVVDDPAHRGAIRRNFASANAAALAAQSPEHAAKYARLKLAGLDDAPCHLAVFADRATEQGHGLGRRTMPEMVDYSAVAAAHTLWLAARAEGIGMGWVSILDPPAIGAILDVPAAWKLIGYFCLGYPEEEDDVPMLETTGWDARRAVPSFLIRR
jgi:5,6-dimethylbenzimidazole synthase